MRCFIGAVRLCFNTQPPEGGWLKVLFRQLTANLFQHTAARRRLVRGGALVFRSFRFQHTAARRRLVPPVDFMLFRPCFNTQPPEGGWLGTLAANAPVILFQHTAARRRLVHARGNIPNNNQFQHTAARRRLEPLSKALLHQVSQPRFR